MNIGVSARQSGVGAPLMPSGIRTGRPTKRALRRRAKEARYNAKHQ